jgi:hypothetical protein
LINSFGDKKYYFFTKYGDKFNILIDTKTKKEYDLLEIDSDELEYIYPKIKDLIIF